MNYKSRLKIKATDPAWLRTALQEEEKEVKENSIAGKDNDRIVAYLKSTSLKGKITDEIPWCSAFVNWCVKKSGTKGTNSAWAKNWNNWGESISKPKRGCIVVFERRYKKKGAKKWTLGGHVGFYMGTDGGDILVLGGNQGNEINITKYKSSKEFITNSKHRVLGYRTFPKEIETSSTKKPSTKKDNNSKSNFNRKRDNKRT